jgi:hypothetical protein
VVKKERLEKEKQAEGGGIYYLSPLTTDENRTN